ncbi:MAG: hypothetical protein M3209_03025 [Acidobacteriota bacterium]|nr:hypothetical protein [Acidobacteriota bacterium]
MMVTIYISFLMLMISLFGFPISVEAQAIQNQSAEGLQNPFLLRKKYLDHNNYITPIFELKTQEEKYLASPAMKSLYLEAIIQFESYVGNYDAAYAYEDMLYADFPSTKNMIERLKKDIPDLKSSSIADYKMLDAVAAIDSIADRQQVIMINEEHRTPFHRALTLELLSKLYAKGFRYFAAETVDETDTELNKRGYPTQKTGFYTADPVYADVIRTALKIGYKIVPYESVDVNCKAPENNAEFCNDKRERGQAQNLYDRILKQDPQAKIFVHVGRGHNAKALLSETFNFMAYYFQHLSKIEPFTIDQLRFSERRNPALEQPLYRLLTKENILQKPSVYESSNGKFYNMGAGYDMLVFHPRVSYKNGRATFLEMNGIRRAEKLDLKKLKLESANQTFNGKEPVLIQAFVAEESADAIPLDQIILNPNQKIPVLMLAKGNFKIRAIDKYGKVLGQYENSIK